MSDDKKYKPFTLPLSISPTAEAQMWALSRMLKQQEKDREAQKEKGNDPTR